MEGTGKVTTRQRALLVWLLSLSLLGVVGCKGEEAPPKAENPATAEAEAEADATTPEADATDVAPKTEAAPTAVDTTLFTTLSLADAFAELGRKDGPELVVRAPSESTATVMFERVVVKQGEGFVMEIATGTGDISAYRANVEANPINTLVAFHVDEPDTLLYETTALEQTQFHFVSTVQVGDEHFTCENVKAGPTFDRAQAEQMLASCRTLRVK